MNYNRKVLPNGLRVITIPMPSFESATSLVMVGAGSRYETRKNSGISHFLEHMAFKGTKKRPSAIDISTLIDGIGGEFNAFTGKETTGYYVKSAVPHVDLSLDVLSDMLQSSKLDKVEIEKEKGVILEEINLYEDTPSRKIGDVYERLLYGDTPMGWDIAGEKDVIRQINREDFQNYMGSLYSADNIAVVVAGGINEDKTVKLIEKYFGKMPKFDTLRYERVVEQQEKPQVLVKQKKTEQVHIALGFRTVPLNHPDRHSLAVLSAILGGGMSSRLFHEVREKRGLAYYVRTSSEQYQDVGNLVSTAGLDPKRAEEGIKVIVEEYAKISKFTRSTGSGQVSKKELTKAKEFLKGHFVLELEDSRSVAGFYSQAELLEEKIENPEEIMAKIDKVTVSDVEKAAEKYFKENSMNLAVIGNFSGGQKFQELLHL
ncbi:MAG: insulinase family protein [Patescibacteria group bacterium]|nr:insulinase family protein [Patescibacteria group bacterium]